MSIITSPLLLGADGVTQYQVSRSLRYDSSASSYLNRTPGSAGNRKTWTWAGWVKRSALGTIQTLFGVNNGVGDNYFGITFRSTDSLSVTNYDTLFLDTTQVFRDTAAWLHLVCTVNTAAGTASDRIILYVNGAKVTSFTSTSYPTQNTDLIINAAVEHGIGRIAASRYFDGYLADIHFIDGQALDPSSFTTTDLTTGQLIPKAYTGSYGTNGFKLNFSDNSTVAALGTDTSGNGNTWTVNNLSVTAGSGNDSLVDTPTSYGTDTGAGGEVRGNCCTLNPLSTTSGTFTQGNLRYTGPGAWRRSNSTISVSTGKWYWEVTLAGNPYSQASNAAFHAFGFGLPSAYASSLEPSVVTDAIVVADNGWYKNFSGSWTNASGTFATGSVLSIAVDLDLNTFVFRHNNNSLVAGTIGGTAGRELTPVIISYDGTQGVLDCNFGQRPFAYTAPSGFKALCDTNLPAPVVAKPNTVMDVVLYTGTGAALTPTSSLGFNPDWIWIKSRSAATDHALYDVVRGAQARLESNTTDAEVTTDGGVTAFNSAGFTLGTLAQVNTSSATYAAWCWDAGTSTVTNTAGSITSQVRANASAGFSIVTYTGTGTNATVGHGLGVRPAFFLVKNRSTTSFWNGWHTSLGGPNNTSYIYLNSTAAAGADGSLNYWGANSFDSTAISLGTFASVNGNGNAMVIYAFAPVSGYSSVGSYVGNGSSDGVFVYTGFRPRWLLVKSSSNALNWYILDTARDTYNTISKFLYPNLSDAEVDGGAGVYVDYLSNGFKWRSSASAFNGSGITYLYIAFAESPLQFARAR